MKTLNQDTRRLIIEKEFAWLVTIALMITSLPFFRNAVVSVLVKLYELFIQHVVGK